MLYWPDAMLFQLRAMYWLRLMLLALASFCNLFQSQATLGRLKYSCCSGESVETAC